MAAAKHVQNGDLTAAERARLPHSSRRSPRLLVIGAGQRGIAYAAALQRDGLDGVVCAVAEPLESRRKDFGRKYIWKDSPAQEGQEFDSWRDFIAYERTRREAEAAGERVREGVDGLFLCTLDQTHKEILEALGPLKLHIMCEKPLATSLQECADIYKTLSPPDRSKPPETVFSIGHVLRYSPHNILLRKLLLRDKVAGEIISIEHTEPVGWWHFSHSYVRGNWRKESTSAPSLLCKSCHDIDFLLWLLCYRTDSGEQAHMPSAVSSTGNLSYFTKRRKPRAAGQATNCFSCSHERACDWSAKKIYLDRQFDKGQRHWPVNIVVPDIENIVSTSGADRGREVLLQALTKDYDASTPESTVESRPWYGRCVWESDNDVLDDQVVTMTWDGDEDDSEDGRTTTTPQDRGPKTAVFHMIAHTQAQCERRGKVSGTHGEVQYDSYQIRVYRFADQSVEVHTPPQAAGGHGGGDGGLAGQFVAAVRAVVSGDMPAHQAQVEYIGCTLEEAFMSHAMVFAAEEARKERKVVDWPAWWSRLHSNMAGKATNGTIPS